MIGRWIILVGFVLILVGGLVVVLEKIGLFRLPGDIQTGGENWKVYFPITSCILLSLLITGILWLLSFLFRGR